MGKPVNTAFVFDDLMPGGWTTLASVIRKLDRSRINPSIICLFGRGLFADELEKEGFKIHFFRVTRLNLIFRIFQIALFLRRNHIDIVHTQLLPSHIIGMTAALLAGVRFRVMQVHSIEPAPAGITGMMMRFFCRRTEMIIPVSAAAEKSFRESYPCFKGKSKVIHNGIDICEFRRRNIGGSLKREDLGITASDLCIITVANLKPEKGYEHLVEAAAILDDPSIHFIIAGKGGEEENIRKAISSKNLGGQFHLLGSRQDVPELLKLADIFVLPSLIEGFGICIIEAFAAGIPVIASDIHGISEIAADKEDAILIRQADAQAIANAISLLKDNPQMRKEISARAMKKAESFDTAKTTANYEDAYFSLARER